jgi:hypothetical protein
LIVLILVYTTTIDDIRERRIAQSIEASSNGQYPSLNAHDFAVATAS